jgi:hypothetical protein
LYIISDDEIKKGDWFIFADAPKEVGNFPNYKIIQATTNHKAVGCKKIIATTNNSLIIQYNITDDDIKIPQIPKSFIEYYITEYNKGNVIDKVMVEYQDAFKLSEGEAFLDTNYHTISKQLVINSDNTINIKSVKDSWTKEEIVKLINKLESIPIIYENRLTGKRNTNRNWEFDNTDNWFDNWLKENL